MELPDILKAACADLGAGEVAAARERLQREAPFAPPRREKRTYTDRNALGTFIRDGFVDRYSGKRLVFPGALRLISLYLPDEFPFHPNWHTAHTHAAYWSLCATLDHVVPVTRGGDDEEHNWVTTSQLRNSAKGNWLLEELGWRLHPPGRPDDWDGLLGWFVQQVRTDPAMARQPAVQRWHRVVKAVL